jgi:chromatin structure-remodeling complex subunit RSC3/30
VPKKRKQGSSIVTEKAIASTNLLSKYRVPPSSSPTACSEADDNAEETSHIRRTVFSTGFLGPSSYWAPFDKPEESPILGITPEASPQDDIDMPMEATMKGALVDLDQIECGAKILALFDDLPLYLQLLKVRYQLCEPWVFGLRLAREVFGPLTELRKQWMQGTKNKKSQTRMLAWSKRIFNNSASPINMDRSTTVSEYFAIATPRWETIALMFTWVGIATTMIPDNHECLKLDDGTVIDKNKLRLLMVEVVEICLSFCDSVGAMSDPLCWALIQHTSLLAESHGDSSMTLI